MGTRPSAQLSRGLLPIVMLVSMAAGSATASKHWTPTQSGAGCDIEIEFGDLINNEGVLAATQTVDVDAIVSDVDYWTEDTSSGSEEDDLEDVPPDQFACTWSATGGTFSDIHSFSTYYTAPATPGTYQVTCTANDQLKPLPEGDTGSRDDDQKSAAFTVKVYVPVHQIEFLEPSGTVGGKVPVRLRVQTCVADLPVLEVRAHEETAVHSADWDDLATPTIEDEQTDENGICTTIYRTDWHTQLGHNGQHTLRAEAVFTLYGSEQRVEQNVECTATVRNLTVSAGPAYLAYDPDSGTGNQISFTLDDAIVDSQTSVSIGIYQPYATLSSGVVGVRSDRLTREAGPDKEYTYIWNGLDDTGSPAPKGVYVYEISASQRAQDDADSVRSMWQISSLAVDQLSTDGSTGVTTVRMAYRVQPNTTCAGQVAATATLTALGPDLSPAATVSSPGPVATCQRNLTPPLEVRFEAAGKYLFLLSALQGDRAADKAHRERPMLQLGRPYVHRP